MRRMWVYLVASIVLPLGALAWAVGTGTAPLLGLDLQGGVSVALSAPAGTDSGAIDQAKSIIDNRVNSLGVAEPDITRQGNQIIVDLPGVKDRQKALDLIGQTAELRFRAVCASLPSEEAAASASTTTTTAPGETTTTAPGETTTTSAPAGGARAIQTQPIAATRQAEPTTDPTTDPTTLPTADPNPDASTTAPPETSDTLPPDLQEQVDEQLQQQQQQNAADPCAPPAQTPEGCQAVPADAFTNPLAPVETTPLAQDEARCHVVLPLRPEKGDDLAASPRELLGPAELTGSDLQGAKAEFSSQSNSWVVNLTLKETGRQKFNAMAGRQFALPAPKNQVAITLDGVVQSSPAFREASFDQNGVEISGSFSESEAKDLARVLKYGALPVKFEQSNVQSVSPSLGKDQLAAGIVAGIIGLGLVALYMFLYYRLLGIVVWFGLALSAAAIYALVAFLGDTIGLTLTLAGVVGLIVSVGVTVDSYVVFFERLKDEVRAGKTVRSSVDRGFTRSFRTILAADLVSLIGAAILYYLAIGSVRGFAFFLGVSTVLDLLVAYFFMHPLVSILARRRALVRAPFVGMAAGLDAKGVTA